MWHWLSSRILRNRNGILVVLGLITVFMAWNMQNVRMSYRFSGLLPRSDSAYVQYERLLSRFSEDGNVIVLAVEDRRLYELEHFQAWWQLGVDLKAQPGVDSVFSEAHLFDLVRDDSLKRFRLQAMSPRMPERQSQVDSLKSRVRDLPFYRGLLYDDSTHTSLMMVFVNAARFNSEQRGDMVDLIDARVAAFEQRGFRVRRSGLPYIRTVVTGLTKAELGLFTGLMLAVVSALLLLFFRSWRVMLICLTVVTVAVVWALGSIGLLGYRVTIVMAIIPPLVVVIGIPNCIFLINKYHQEYASHRNRVKALSRVVYKVGRASFMTNTTTAVGFATFIPTYSDTLRQFGVVASLNIMAVFALSLLLVPILFSLQGEPKERHLAHLDRRWVDGATRWLERIVLHHRRLVYMITATLVGIGLLGVTRLRNESRIVDDLPQEHAIMDDLRFLEQRFKGVMPLEVMVETKGKGQVLKDANLRRIARLQDSLAAFPELSRSLSVADAVKFIKQSFYGGDPARYDLIRGTERTFILPYLENAATPGGPARGFLDEDRRSTRITMQVADIGTARMDPLLDRVRAQVDSIFSGSSYRERIDSVRVGDRIEVRRDSLLMADYRVAITGTSVVFLEGSKYMVKNLAISLVMAVAVIAVLMALMLGSLRMVVISLVPNLVPLVATAGLMGYLGIPIKPSTILVFSVAFGIAVDDAIHYLSRYRMELKLGGRSIREAVLAALHEAGVSMMYTSIVLFSGFSLFSFSEFGGTQALGLLVSFTLLVAMCTNLIVLPSLLLSFEQYVTLKSFREPLLDILDEEGDIELAELPLESAGRGTANETESGRPGVSS
ncbi:MAG: MMPL family transporter [Flavobacteriales bacterium]|nr:MAG: MMPL family transporter [Flavobacteriales bacterium]